MKNLLFLISIFMITSCKNDTIQSENNSFDDNEPISEKIKSINLDSMVVSIYEYANEKDFSPFPNIIKSKIESIIDDAKGTKYEKRLNKTLDSINIILDAASSKEVNNNHSVYLQSDLVCVNSEYFIKKDLRYPSSADFSNFDCSVENNSDGSYTILRKVGAKNAFGVESEFIYKVRLGFTGGNDVDINNWKLISMRSEEVR